MRIHHSFVLKQLFLRLPELSNFESPPAELGVYRVNHAVAEAVRQGANSSPFSAAANLTE